MMENKPIYITEFDLERLKKLLLEAQSTKYRNSEYLEKLQTEIQRAVVVPPHDIPSDVITMNSVVCLKDGECLTSKTYVILRKRSDRRIPLQSGRDPSLRSGSHIVWFRI